MLVRLGVHFLSAIFFTFGRRTCGEVVVSASVDGGNLASVIKFSKLGKVHLYGRFRNTFFFFFFI